MKTILLSILILISVNASSQITMGGSLTISSGSSYSFSDPNCVGNNDRINPKWDSTLLSICGLGKFCCYVDGSHYYKKNTKPVIPQDPDGSPVYGPQQAYLGVINRRGIFIPTNYRDHFIGKNEDKELLDDPARLNQYVKLKYHL